MVPVFRTRKSRNGLCRRWFHGIGISCFLQRSPLPNCSVCADFVSQVRIRLSILPHGARTSLRVLIPTYVISTVGDKDKTETYFIAIGAGTCRCRWIRQPKSCPEQSRYRLGTFALGSDVPGHVNRSHPMRYRYLSRWFRAAAEDYDIRRQSLRREQPSRCDQPRHECCRCSLHATHSLDCVGILFGCPCPNLLPQSPNVSSRRR